MTLSQNPIRAQQLPGPDADRLSEEAPLQAYIRRLHESRNEPGVDEPVRGKDRYLGLVL